MAKRKQTGKIRLKTRGISDAVQGVREQVQAGQAILARLTPQQRARPANKVVIAAIEHRAKILDLLQKITSDDVCCDQQTQNCEYDLDLSK